MYKEKLHNIYEKINRFFVIAPLIGLFFIGISVYYKIVNNNDIYDIINLILDFVSLTLFGIGYFFFITSYTTKKIGTKIGKRLTAYTYFAIVYFVYGIALALITIYYNIMVFLVISISVFMLLLIPGIDFTIFLFSYFLLYTGLALLQILKMIPSAVDQVSLEREGGPLIVIFTIKLIILIVLNYKKYLYLHLIRFEEEYAGKNNSGDDKQIFFELDMKSIKIGILSKREREVTQLLCNGFTYQKIAEALGISHGTVQNHIKNIYRKFEVNSKSQLINHLK